MKQLIPIPGCHRGRQRAESNTEDIQEEAHANGQTTAENPSPYPLIFAMSLQSESPDNTYPSQAHQHNANLCLKEGGQAPLHPPYLAIHCVNGHLHSQFQHTSLGALSENSQHDVHVGGPPTPYPLRDQSLRRLHDVSPHVPPLANVQNVSNRTLHQPGFAPKDITQARSDAISLPYGPHNPSNLSLQIQRYNRHESDTPTVAGGQGCSVPKGDTRG